MLPKIQAVLKESKLRNVVKFSEKEAFDKVMFHIENIMEIILQVYNPHSCFKIEDKDYLKKRARDFSFSN